MIPAWFYLAWLGLLALFSWVSFRFGYRAAQWPAQQEPICGCGHHLAMHEPRDARMCHDIVYHRTHGTTRRCTCQAYVGPEPVAGLWIPPIAKEANQ